MMKPLLLFASLLFLLCISSCSDTIEDFGTDQLELDFFPVELGKYWEYQLDSIVYSGFSGTETETTSYAREEIFELDTDATNETRYLVRRTWRRSLEDSWTLTDIWTMTRSESQATKTEENIRLINLIFPPREGASWSGDSFVRDGFIVTIGGENLEMFKNWDFEITSRMEQELVGISTYEDVITVQQADDENAIELRFSQEKYAKNIGLVYREQRILDTQCIDVCEGQPWEEKAQRGFILRQTIIDFN